MNVTKEPLFELFKSMIINRNNTEIFIRYAFINALVLHYYTFTDVIEFNKIYWPSFTSLRSYAISILNFDVNKADSNFKDFSLKYLSRKEVDEAINCEKIEDLFQEYYKWYCRLRNND